MRMSSPATYVYLNPPRVWNLSFLTTTKRDAGAEILEGLGTYIWIVASACLFIDSKNCLHEIARRCPLHSCKVSQQMSCRSVWVQCHRTDALQFPLHFNVWYLLILEINPEIKKNCQQKLRLLTTMKHSAHAKKPSWSPLPAIALLFNFWQHLYFQTIHGLNPQWTRRVTPAIRRF